MRNYEIVFLEEKILTVLNPMRLSNADPKISNKIGLVWSDFSKRCSEVENKVTNKPICTYSNYKSDEKGYYDVSIGYETFKDCIIEDGWVKKIIPSGKYAKFVVRGNVIKEVPNFWVDIWKMNLPRKFECDFEEYCNADILNSQVNVYISLI